MKRDKVVDQIIGLLRSQDKHGGHFHQEPYKGDFFRLFVLANEEGSGLKADRLHNLIAARAPGRGKELAPAVRGLAGMGLCLVASEKGRFPRRRPARRLIASPRLYAAGW
jgi:hypothetical protein